jgi:beta-mannanase
MEAREFTYGRVQGNYEWLKLWRQLYAYITSGAGLRKFEALHFCYTERITQKSGVWVVD